MNNRLFVVILVTLFTFGGVGTALAAPNWTFQKSLLPTAADSFDLGTTTGTVSSGPWRTLFVSQICLSTVCNSTWPTGGGGTGGGTWATTTSTVAGRLINYPLNSATDIVAIGSTSTTTSEFYFDPNTGAAKLYTLNGLIGGNAGLLYAAATSSLAVSTGLTSSGTLGAQVGGTASTISFASIAANSLWVNQTGASAVPTVLATSSLSIGGNAGTATALAADGANCSSGSAPLGVDTAGAVQNCFDVWTEAENTAAAYAVQATTITLNGTANQITSSAGAQSLAANRTWTLSLPSFVQFPGTASTTGLSALKAWFGATATSSFASDGKLTLANVTGSNQCLHADTNGLITGTGSDCGSGSGTSAFEIATTSTIAAPDLAYFTKTTGRTTLGSVATTSFTPNADFSTTGTIGAFVGGANSTLALNMGTAHTWTALQQFSNATSTLFSSTYASTTRQVIGNSLTFGGVTGTAWSDFCVSITGSASLCDGNDASSAGGGSFPFSADSTWGQTVYSTSTPTLWFKSGLFASSTSRLGTTTFDGNVGIASSSPGFPLTLGDTVYGDVPWGTGAALPTTIYSADDHSIMFWNPKTAAFGAFERDTGSLASSEIGSASTLFGYNSKATAYSAFAAGDRNTASGNGSFVTGSNNTASGGYSFAFGHSNTASDSYAGAAGESNTASGYASFAGGSTALATSSFAFVWGSAGASAGGGAAPVALGVEAHAYGDGALAIGGDANSARNNYATVVGGLTNLINLGATDLYATIIGGENNHIYDNAIGSLIVGGFYSDITAQQAVTLGSYLVGSSTESITIGSGISASSKLKNDQANSLYVGFNSNIPTFVVTPAGGLNTHGKVGVGTSSPYALFSIEAASTTGSLAPTTLFAISSTTGGTSTSTLFKIDNTGIASTTGLVISNTGGTGTRCLQVAADGTVSANASACGTGGGGGDAFTHPAAGQSATTSLMLLNGQASTTQMSAGKAYFGTTATSTFGTDGALTLATQLLVGSGGTGRNTFTSSQLLYGNGTTALSSVATTTLGFSGPFNGYASIGTLVGGSNTTLTWTGLATTSQPSSSNLLVSNGGAGVYGVATSSLTTTSFPFNTSGTLGALSGGSNTTWTWWGLATTSALTSGQLLYNTTGGNGVASVATTSITCSGNITCTGFTALGSASAISFTGTLGISSGGTGTTTAPSSQLLYGGGSSAYQSVATSTLTTSGFPFNTSGTLGALVGGSNTTWTYWGLATSTAIANTQVLYGTSASGVGSEAAFTYDSAADNLGFLFGSSTSLTSTAGAWLATTGGKVGVGTTSPFAKFGIQGIAGDTNPIFDVASSSGSAYFRVLSTGTTTIRGPIVGTSTQYVYSTASGKGAAVIMEDEGGGACTQITTKAGVVKAAVIACPTEI